MATQDARAETTNLIRTSVLLPESVDAELRRLAAEGNRPLSREIRAAIEAHIEAAKANGSDGAAA